VAAETERSAVLKQRRGGERGAAGEGAPEGAGAALALGRGV
jgi:hypothetical protein